MDHKHCFRGIIPPIVTPLTDAEELDEAALRRLIGRCRAHGVDGIFVNGTSGEAMRVTDTVWEMATRVALEYARPDFHVFCGAIDSSTARTVEKLKKIEEMGGSLAVCTAPFYIKNFGQDEIIRHFETLCRSASLKLAIYNIPNTTHVNILPQTIAQLAENEKIVVCKDSTGNLSQLQELLALTETLDIAVLNGAEDLCAQAMLAGCDGCIPGLAGFFPEVYLEIYRAVVRGDAAGAIKLQKKANRLRKVIFAGPCWVSVMKYLLEVLQLGGRKVSEPLPPMSEVHCAAVQTMLRQQGYLAQ